MVAVPIATPRTSPEASTVAIAGEPETYDTVPPDVPDAPICTVRLATTDSCVFTTRSGPVTQTVAVPVRFPLVAVMFAEPGVTPVTTPVALTVTALALVDHVTGPGGESTTRSRVWPSRT